MSAQTASTVDWKGIRLNLCGKLFPQLTESNLILPITLLPCDVADPWSPNSTSFVTNKAEAPHAFMKPTDF